MDQLICASLSQTHYWYEVGMLKVPTVIYDFQNVKVNVDHITPRNSFKPKVFFCLDGTITFRR